MNDLEKKIKEMFEDDNIRFLKMDENGVVYVEPKLGNKIATDIVRSRINVSRIKEITAVVVQSSTGDYVVTANMSEEEERETGKPFYIMNAYQELGADGLMEIFSDPKALHLLEAYQKASAYEKNKLTEEMTSYLGSLVSDLKASEIKKGKKRLEDAIAQNESAAQPE